MPQLTPDEIYAESFRIIDREVGPHGFGDRQWTVVRRMIHASGDLELARSVVFTHEALEAGVRALVERAPIVTDVTMVAAGINKAGLASLHVPLHCFINEPHVHEEAGRRQLTRSYCAMEQACRDFAEGIFVVGNAPTALMAVCEAIRTGAAHPRLVVAMPVGFVSVVESKQEALELDVPVIAVPGRKGGSPLAAAAINALVQLALEERDRGP